MDDFFRKIVNKEFLPNLDPNQLNLNASWTCEPPEMAPAPTAPRRSERIRIMQEKAKREREEKAAAAAAAATAAARPDNRPCMCCGFDTTGASKIHRNTLVPIMEIDCVEVQGRLYRTVDSNEDCKLDLDDDPVTTAGRSAKSKSKRTQPGQAKGPKKTKF